MGLLAPINVAITLVTTAAVLALWFAVLRPADNEARDGARAYCTGLQKQGALHEPMDRCIAEVLAAQRLTPATAAD